jgi:O-antigen ligase
MRIETIQRIDLFLSRLIFGGLAVLLTASPWLFGAWEMWWFWVFTTGIFSVAALFSLRLVFCGTLGTRHLRSLRPYAPLGCAYLVFLGYAFIRALQADVRLDAERSFLLHLTAGLTAIPILMSFTVRQIRGMALLLMLNLMALGLYGIVNHFVSGNAFVMWMPGYPQYQQGHLRATGSYYCPDHFAGILEIGLALGLAVCVTRDIPRRLKAVGLPLVLIALTGIVLSKSRGAGMTVAVLGAGFLAVGFGQYRPGLRWGLRGVVLAILVAGTVWVLGSDHPYAVRFRHYPWHEIQHSDRGVMIGGALRAWRNAPVWGIGPGQHRHWWAHVAASGDGDRAAGRWPTRLNNSFHSFEVHSDWVQLMEEYGVVGLILFVILMGLGVKLLWDALRREAGDRSRRDWHFTGREDLWAPLAALGAVLAMGFHSLGDFNLQMPATVWTTAAIVALGLVLAHPRGSGKKGREGQ